jgi:hypothetical protein
VLKRARAVFYVYRNKYQKFAPPSVLLTVYRAVVRSILEYCADIFLPDVYFSAQFERVQKLALRTYLRDFDMPYENALHRCNMESLASRRGALAVVNLVKFTLSSHFILPGFFCYATELPTRRSGRGGTARDLVLVKNYPFFNQITTFNTYSPSFKKSFLFRAVTNFNIFRRIFDLDSFYFKSLRKALSLFSYNAEGIVNLR